LSDIFEGDIVTELNGESIIDARDLRAKLKSKGSCEVSLNIIRDGVNLKKAVQLNP